MRNRSEQYNEAVKLAREVFLRKNLEYGDSIRFGGGLSACYNIVGPAMRLIPIVFHSKDHGLSNSKIVRGILIDILNYAAIGLFFMSEGNWLGEE